VVAAPQPAAPIAPASAQPVAPAPVWAPQANLEQTASALPGSGLRIAGIATMAVGAAGIAGGVVLTLKANSLASQLESSNTSYSRNKESTRASYETLAWVSYGVGAACVAGGAILYYLGHSQAQSAQVALVPVAGPGQVGAVLQGAF
jgi:hypothetical protein